MADGSTISKSANLVIEEKVACIRQEKKRHYKWAGPRAGLNPLRQNCLDLSGVEEKS